MTKIALLDVDGVVADWTGTLLRAVGSRLTPEDITSYDIFSTLGDEGPVARDICQDEEFWRELRVIPGAPPGVERLRREGYEVYWLTSPWYTCKGWYQARGAWLAQHFGSRYNQMLPLSAKHMVRGDLFVDDRIDNVARWVRHNQNPGFVYRQPYNQATADDQLPRFTWEAYGRSPSIETLWGRAGQDPVYTDC